MALDKVCVLAWPAGLLIHHLASGHPAICHQLWWPDMVGLLVCGPSSGACKPLAVAP